jgi:hypothetical protein
MVSFPALSLPIWPDVRPLVGVMMRISEPTVLSGWAIIYRGAGGVPALRNTIISC